MGALLLYRSALAHRDQGPWPTHHGRGGRCRGRGHRGDRSACLDRDLPGAVQGGRSRRPAALHRWPGRLLWLRHHSLHRAQAGSRRETGSNRRARYPVDAVRRGGRLRQPQRQALPRGACKARGLRRRGRASRRARASVACTHVGLPAGVECASRHRGGLRLRLHRGRLQERGEKGEGVHRRGRHHAGGAVAAPVDPVQGATARPLPRAAQPQSLAVHVLPRTRGLPRRGFLARDPGASGRRRGHRAPHRRHAQARQDRGAGQGTGRGTAGRSEGDRRAPDAHRPRAQ